ncbi:BlaI/MecI/CopY family transcriptional regulator [Paenibacillus sp. J23TS9]|uniref:BlaI/MecI/CopY family transcriptional regulator n=1 Tax=Paenibacillus sp. J23TS9 TaxID=2807193 RepID=UPI001BCBB32B|nr:BlaI/MecI/CopY family transcriptional regulator [Paenibacillus sp. J23TS9]
MVSYHFRFCNCDCARRFLASGPKANDELLWQKEPLSASEIIIKLTQQMQWSDQTIKTFLNRLHKKNAIRFEKSGRNDLYYPLISHDEYF